MVSRAREPRAISACAFQRLASACCLGVWPQPARRAPDGSARV